jgi:membrane fusion protein (multidrug efflux system)
MPAPKKKRAARVMQLLLVVAIAAGGYVTWNGRGKEVTDDAQVEAHVASVAPRIPGQVKRVDVQDNQTVKPGDLLVELDDRDGATKLAAARADLDAARAALDAAEAQLAITASTVDTGIAAASAELSSARARSTLSHSNLRRIEQLLATQAIAVAEAERARVEADQASAQVAVAQARLRGLRTPGHSKTVTDGDATHVVSSRTSAQVEAANAQVELATARVEQAQAAVDQATLNGSYSEIRAQVGGTIARRNVEVGQLASSERPLMAIVSLEDAWVVANFKEDQIAHIVPGQKARIKIDAFAGRVLDGTVDGISGGTGSRFSLLPPDNASGNFTKVVQRVPVLIKLADHPGVALRPGMSATVTVLFK